MAAHALLFSFDFSFENLDQDSDGDDRIVEMAFLLDERAAARTGYTHPDRERSPPTPFEEWLANTAEEMEEEFTAVHDCFSTWDDDTLIEGFHTYEIDTIEKARELMKRWRDGFVAFLGEEGVGPVVEIPKGASPQSTRPPATCGIWSCDCPIQRPAHSRVDCGLAPKPRMAR